MCDEQFLDALLDQQGLQVSQQAVLGMPLCGC
jgi:hypothetical protein